ncbi:hypothetical protein ACYFX5_01945 [Bremerella sp. T1]|uniref:hypothetical protein n=1 Tax=Bremerella sp. TYQ1 TaxID=3119568 RepID=UPI001CCABFC8|nr:hypothetical protein [Bremerella volcania]UBM37039.1 hypothetical protein LA756_03895 [Bremerella volcania]
MITFCRTYTSSFRSLAGLLTVLTILVVTGCEGEEIPSEPENVQRYSDQDAQKFTVEDLENPNIVGRLTQEQRKQIIKDARAKKKTTDG